MSMSGKSSMRRKQSNSLLQALGKGASRTSAIPIHPVYATPPSSTSSTFLSDAASEYHGSPSIYSPESPMHAEYSSSSTRAASSSYNIRSVSSGATEKGSIRGEKGASPGGVLLKGADDVFKLVKDRLLSWSYLMQWYQGSEGHWLNTVKVSHATVEASLGQAKMEQRARHYYLLTTSLSSTFEIIGIADYLRALLRILDEWELYTAEGGAHKVKSLFKGQKSKKTPGAVSDISSGPADAESSLLHLHLPFAPDFHVIHATTCSFLRDIYRKILCQVLPLPPGFTKPISFAPLLRPDPAPPYTNTSSLQGIDPAPLFHPTTYIGSTAFSEGKYKGPGVPTGPYDTARNQMDSLHALMKGDLSDDRTLVGQGQEVTPLVSDLLSRVDMKLRKQFSFLYREGEALARKVLDEEIASLMSSMTSAEPMVFDYPEALSGGGNGWRGGTPQVDEGVEHLTIAQYGDYGIEEEHDEDGLESNSLRREYGVA